MENECHTIANLLIVCHAFLCCFVIEYFVQCHPIISREYIKGFFGNFSDPLSSCSAQNELMSWKGSDL
jgi:hypothetical protein